MDKIKLLTFTVIALLFLNLGTLAFLVLAKPNVRNEMPPQPKEIIIEKLHFDKKQQQDFDNLIQWHRSTINGIEDKMRQAKNQLYLQLLKSNVDSAAKDSLINVLANYQKDIEQTHFTHFQGIKKLCRHDQLQNYYDLTQELSKIFSKPPHPRHE